MSIEIRKKEKLQQLKQWAYLSTHPSKRFNSFCYDDDDDEDYTLAVTPVLSTEEPDNSLNQFEDFFDSNDEFSLTDDDSFSIDKIDYVEASPPNSKLVSSEVMEIVIPEIEASNDIPTPFYDPIISGTPPTLTPSREKYEASYDDQSCSDEDVPEKIFSTLLFDEEIIPIKIDPHPYNAESDLIESLRTHDSFLLISSKIDSLFDEFTDELTLLKLIPPGIDGTDCDFEEDVRLIEKLLYDNSSPRPPKEFISANSDAEIESFSPSPILVKYSDSLMKEINLSCTPDYPMSSSIEDDDYDSERDILILKDLPSNNTLSFAKKESFHFDIPPFSRPPAKLPDESDEVIKSSVEVLVPIPSESEGIPDNTCDVPFRDNSPPFDVSKDQFEEFFDSNDDSTSIDDDYFSIDNINYVEASPPNSELQTNSEVMEIVIQEVGGIDDDILLTINDDILRENLLNVNHLFAKIEASNDIPTPFYDPIISRTPPTLTPSRESDFFLEEVDAFLAVEDEPTSSQFPQSYLDLEGDILLLEAFLNDDHSSDFKTKSSSTSLNSLLKETNNFDNSLPESDNLCFDVEEISSGSTTTRSDIFLPEYEASYDDQSCSDEDVPEKIFSTLLFDEEIIPMKIDPHPYNAESDLIESLRTHDSSLLISSKIDSLFDDIPGNMKTLANGFCTQVFISSV
nr:hypothetical protein [Tanacetum cinerariifolium]